MGKGQYQDHLNRYRQSGRTSRQMAAAPLNAIYVWVNSNTYYPERLARSLGREDLEIIPPSKLDSEQWTHGRHFSGIVVDHFTDLTFRQIQTLYVAKSRIRTDQNHQP